MIRKTVVLKPGCHCEEPFLINGDEAISVPPISIFGPAISKRTEIASSLKISFLAMTA